MRSKPRLSPPAPSTTDPKGFLRGLEKMAVASASRLLAAQIAIEVGGLSGDERWWLRRGAAERSLGRELARVAGRSDRTVIAAVAAVHAPGERRIRRRRRGALAPRLAAWP